jgi:RNA polymerase primary sigma factor
MRQTNPLHLDLRDSLSRYVAEIAMIPLLTLDEEKAVVKEVRAGNEAAQDKLVRSNLRLVVALAQRFSGYGVPVADLVSEGNLGLMRAAELFDPRFETRFSTYAVFWIKQKIQRAVLNQSQTVRLPAWKAHRLQKLQKVNRLLAQEMGHEPTIEELADALELQRGQVEKVRGERLEVVSLDGTPHENSEESLNLGQTLPDERMSSPSQQVAQRDMLETMLVSLNELEDRELNILALRFGLTGGPVQSFHEIGARFNVSREWIRRLQEGALVKMYRALADPRPAPPEHEKRRVIKKIFSRLRRLTGQTPRLEMSMSLGLALAVV